MQRGIPLGIHCIHVCSPRERQSHRFQHLRFEFLTRSLTIINSRRTHEQCHTVIGCHRRISTGRDQQPHCLRIRPSGGQP